MLHLQHVRQIVEPILGLRVLMNCRSPENSTTARADAILFVLARVPLLDAGHQNLTLVAALGLATTDDIDQRHCSFLSVTGARSGAALDSASTIPSHTGINAQYRLRITLREHFHGASFTIALMQLSDHPEH
jgi:hypothetical protein